MAQIVHICESLAAGVLTVLSSLINAQIEDGHEVCLIGSQRRPEIAPGWRLKLHSSLRYIDLPMEREVRPVQDAMAGWRLRRLLVELRPDVVHLHSSKAGALGRIAALGLGAVVIYQPHGLSYLREDVSAAKRTFYRLIERGLTWLPAEVVACSPGERDALRGVVPEARRRLVLNGVDLSVIRPATPEADVPRPVIGTCGRIAPQKNPAFFAEVARTVGDAAEFRWIGDGDAQGRALLESAGVRVLGWMSRDRVLEELGRLHIYLQTSAWEGLPVAVIEAMAARLPVVATDIVGNRDLIWGTRAGRLVNTPEQMAQALEELIRDPARRGACGRAAQRVAHERYSERVMVDAYYELYGLDRHPPTSLASRRARA